MNGKRILAIVFIGVACVLTFAAPVAQHTGALGDPGPVLLPRIVGLCMGLLAIVMFWQRSRDPVDSKVNVESPVVISLSLMAIPLFYLMFEYLGYTIAVALYLFLATGLLGLHTSAALVRYALVATVFSLMSGMLFARLLDLPLPGVLP